MSGHRQPDYRLTLQGQTISPQLRARLSRLRLVDRRGMEADQLDITLVDDDGRLALPPRGAELTLAIGWAGQPLVERGSYIVDEVEHSGSPDVINIRARSADMRQGLPGKRTQSWEAMTLEAILRTIAGRHGLEPVTGDSLRGVLMEHIDQTEESDLHFLTRLGERFDAIATVKGGHLLFTAAGRATTASGIALPSVTITRQSGDQHRYITSDRDSYSGVVAGFHTPENAERNEVIAGSDENPKRLRPTYATEQDALDAARAEWQRLQRGHAEFSITLAEGRPELAPETPVTVRGFKEEIDTTPWVITQVSHDLGESGYVSGVKMEVHSD